MSPRSAVPPATERELLQLLERKHAKQGNGGSGEYAFLTHVRNDGGFNANRTFDAVAVSLWPSRGYEIHVYEVKVSRSDWLRELSKPDKSEDAWQIGDRYSIVATAGIVQEGELPEGWGLIEAHGGKVTDAGIAGRKLRTVRAAAYHGPTEKAGQRTISRGLLVSMLRRAGAVPDHETPSEKMLRQAAEAARAERDGFWREHVDRAREQARDTNEAIRRFVSLSGVQVVPQYGADAAAIDQRARTIRAALADDGHQDRVQANLRRLRDQLRQQADNLDHVLEGDGHG